MTNKFAVSPSAIALGSVAVAFAAGAGAGYLLSKKQFEGIADREIQEFKEEYAARQEAHIIAIEKANQNKIEKGELPTMVEELGYVSTGAGEEPDEVITTSVFDNAQRVPDWNQEAEEELRKTELIYILTKDEFFTNKWDFEEQQFTYYEGDDVVCDNHGDVMVTNVVEQLGTDCLSKFGYGSNDEDVVYLINERLRNVYEITRTDGKYSETVLGIEDEAELRHSSSPRKFRSYHDV